MRAWVAEAWETWTCRGTGATEVLVSHSSYGSQAFRGTRATRVWETARGSRSRRGTRATWFLGKIGLPEILSEKKMHFLK